MEEEKQVAYKKINRARENDVKEHERPTLGHHPHGNMPPHGVVLKAKPHHLAKIKPPKLEREPKYL